jgi:hypothetical protein
MIIKRPFGAASAGASSVPRRSGAQPGGARRRALWLGLDRRLKMGEDSASGMPWGDGLGTGDAGRRRRTTRPDHGVGHPSS